MNQNIEIHRKNLARYSLEPAKDAERRAALVAMFDLFLVPQNTNAETVVLGYMEVTQDYPAWVVQDAVRRYLHGEVEGHGGRWIPQPGELAQVCREVAAWRYRLERRRRRDEAYEHEEPLTAQQLARRREKADWARSIFNGGG